MMTVSNNNWSVLMSFSKLTELTLHKNVRVFVIKLIYHNCNNTSGNTSGKLK